MGSRWWGRAVVGSEDQGDPATCTGGRGAQDPVLGLGRSAQGSGHAVRCPPVYRVPRTAAWPSPVAGLRTNGKGSPGWAGGTGVAPQQSWAAVHGEDPQLGRAEQRHTGWGCAGDRQAPWWHGGTRGSSGESDKMGDKRGSGENGSQGKVRGMGWWAGIPQKAGEGRGAQGRAGGHG